MESRGRKLDKTNYGWKNINKQCPNAFISKSPRYNATVKVFYDDKIIYQGGFETFFRSRITHPNFRKMLPVFHDQEPPSKPEYFFLEFSLNPNRRITDLTSAQSQNQALVPMPKVPQPVARSETRKSTTNRGVRTLTNNWSGSSSKQGKNTNNIEMSELPQGRISRTNTY